MRIAALDFGSNSLKCLVAEVTPHGLVYGQDIRIVNRFGSSLDEHGKLSALVIQNCVAEVNSLLASIQPLAGIKAVGTEALRKAANSSELTSALKAHCGIDLKIISGEEEARLAWEGVLSSLPNPNAEILLFDSGGSSSEFIHSSGGNIITSISLPIGAVSLTKNFVHSDPISCTDLELLAKGIEADLILPFQHPARLVATGGGVLACAKVAKQAEISDPAKLDGVTLTAGQLDAQIALYKAYSLSQRIQIPGMEAERADIILAAAMLYKAIMQRCDVPGLTISSRGLRHGLLQSFAVN